MFNPIPSMPDPRQLDLFKSNDHIPPGPVELKRRLMAYRNRIAMSHPDQAILHHPQVESTQAEISNIAAMRFV